MGVESRSIYPMKRLCDVGVSLLDCEHKTPKPASYGYPYIAIPDIKEGRLDLSNVRLISKDDFAQWTRKIKPQAGDIILTRRGRVGDTAVVPIGLECAIGQNLVILRSNKTQIDPSFLRWALRGNLYQEEVYKFLNVGAIFDSLNCKDIPKFEIPVPTLSEQKAIAHILGTLDDKIELNRQMNETLEAMARAIFKSWFVDFDPVRAKMEGRQPAGMDAATADLFPDEFEESSLGLIPKEWKVKKLGDLAQNISRKFNFSNKTEVIFINTGDVLLGRFLHSNRISKEGLPGQAKKSICENDILMSEIRPANGRYAYVDFDSSDYVVSTKFMVIHALDEIEPRLLYRILILPVTLTELQVVAESRSGTFPQITFDSINYLPIILPPKTIQLAFLRIVSLLEEQIKINELQSNTLVTIRDTLLPKLMSGEIRIKEAGKMFEKLHSGT